jgi:hypothetical protein
MFSDPEIRPIIRALPANPVLLSKIHPTSIIQNFLTPHSPLLQSLRQPLLQDSLK